MVGDWLGFALLYIGSLSFDNIKKETWKINRMITMPQTTQNFEMNSIQVGISSLAGKIPYNKFNGLDKL